MVMHTRAYSTGKTRTWESVREVPEQIARVFGLPIGKHRLIEYQELFQVFWESNASSDGYKEWRTVRTERFKMDGSPL
jgi:hypothetical protein